MPKAEPVKLSTAQFRTHFTATGRDFPVNIGNDGENGKQAQLTNRAKPGGMHCTFRSVPFHHHGVVLGWLVVKRRRYILTLTQPTPPRSRVQKAQASPPRHQPPQAPSHEPKPNPIAATYIIPFHPPIPFSASRSEASTTSFSFLVTYSYPARLVSPDKETKKQGKTRANWCGHGYSEFDQSPHWAES